jgi:uncharacterized membrane protein
MSELDSPEEQPTDKIPKEVQEILENPSVSDEQKETLIEVTQVRSSSFSGPLPPPEILEHYNGVVENGAERIMKMAENQASHRMKLEDKAVTSQLSQSKKGQIFGFIIALLLIASSVYCAFSGYESLGKILGGSTILGLVAIFVTGKLLQRKK